MTVAGKVSTVRKYKRKAAQIHSRKAKHCKIIKRKKYVEQGGAKKRDFSGKN